MPDAGRLRGMQILLVLASTTAFVEVVVYGLIIGPRTGDAVLYDLLGRTLAATGIYARHVTETGIVPEPLRTVGYPGFLAVLYRIVGDGYSVVVAGQAALLATVPPAVFFISRRFLSPRLSLCAAWAIPLYLPLAYWGAWVYSDLLAACAFTLGIAALVWASEGNPSSRAAIAGALFGWAAVTRPTLLYVSLAVAAWLLVDPLRGRTLPRRSAWSGAKMK